MTFNTQYLAAVAFGVLLFLFPYKSKKYRRECEQALKEGKPLPPNQFAKLERIMGWIFIAMGLIGFFGIIK